VVPQSNHATAGYPFGFTKALRVAELVVTELAAMVATTGVGLGGGGGGVAPGVKLVSAEKSLSTCELLYAVTAKKYVTPSTSPVTEVVVVVPTSIALV
jgi:hypothetical protein